jgi:hypothetical protein
MFIFTKRKAITVDCITARADVYNNFAIAPALKYTPDWWKSLPRPTANLPTTGTNMRRCAGFVDLYKRSFAFPMWNDLAFTVAEDKTLYWQFADGISAVDFHPVEQRGGFAPSTEYTHAKIVSPWQMKSKSDVEWMLAAPTYNQVGLTDYIVCPGVVNFKYQNSTNVNILVTNTTQRTFVIPHGHPLVHLVPLTERPINLRTELVTAEEFAKLGNVRVSFIGAYDAIKKVIKSKGVNHD